MGVEGLVPGTTGFGLVDEEGTAIDSRGIDGGVEGVLKDTPKEVPEHIKVAVRPV